MRVWGFGCRAVGDELHDLNAEMVGCTGWKIEAVVGSDLGMGRFGNGGGGWCPNV